MTHRVLRLSLSSPGANRPRTLTLPWALSILLLAALGLVPGGLAWADTALHPADGIDAAAIEAHYAEYTGVLRSIDPSAEVHLGPMTTLDQQASRTLTRNDLWTSADLSQRLRGSLVVQGSAAGRYLELKGQWADTERTDTKSSTIDVAAKQEAVDRPPIRLAELLETALSQQGRDERVIALHLFDVEARVLGRTVVYPSMAWWLQSPMTGAITFRVGDPVLPSVNVLAATVETTRAELAREALELERSRVTATKAGGGLLCLETVREFQFETHSPEWVTDAQSSGLMLMKADETFHSSDDASHAPWNANHRFFYQPTATCSCTASCSNVGTMSFVEGGVFEHRFSQIEGKRHYTSSIARLKSGSPADSTSTDGSAVWAHGGGGIVSYFCPDQNDCYEVIEDLLFDVSVSGTFGFPAAMVTITGASNSPRIDTTSYVSFECPPCTRLLSIEGQVTGLARGERAELYAEYADQYGDPVATGFGEVTQTSTDPSNGLQFVSPAMIPQASAEFPGSLRVWATVGGQSCGEQTIPYVTENIAGIQIDCSSPTTTQCSLPTGVEGPFHPDLVVDFGDSLAGSRVRVDLTTNPDDPALARTTSVVRMFPGGESAMPVIIPACTRFEVKAVSLDEAPMVCSAHPRVDVADGPIEIEVDCYDLPGEACDINPAVCPDAGHSDPCYEVTRVLRLVREAENATVTTTDDDGEVIGSATTPYGPEIVAEWRFTNTVCEKAVEEGPVVYLRMKDDQVYEDESWLPLVGVARSGGQALVPQIYLDGQPAAVSFFETGRPDGTTCDEVPTIGCNPDSQFVGALDLSTLSHGKHRLVVGVPSLGEAGVSLQELEFWIVPDDAPLLDARVGSATLPTTMECGETVQSSVKMVNVGSSDWTQADAFVLGAVQDSDPFTRPLRMSLPAGTVVEPGQSYTWTFDSTAPTAAGTYVTDWKMLKTGVSWFGEVASSTVEVSCPDAPQNDAASDQRDLPATMECGATQTVTLSTLNNGDTTWSEADGYRLGAVGGSDPFTTVMRRTLPAGVSVEPTEIHPFQVTLTAPSQPGTYRTDWQMLQEGVEWFGEIVSGDIEVYCPASNATVTVVPSADGSVFQANPTLTLPNDPTLYVEVDFQGEGKRSLLRFDLPTIPGDILAAKLRVRTRSDVPELAVYSVRNHPWSEATLNWNNHLPASPQDFTYLRSGMGLWSEQWHEIDVTEAVTCCGSVDLGLASGYVADQRLYGRTSIHQPELVIVYEPD